MTPLMTAYLIAWIAACLSTVFVMAWHRKTLSLFSGYYWRYLMVAWKMECGQGHGVRVYGAWMAGPGR
jgi:hypothetical protein